MARKRDMLDIEFRLSKLTRGGKFLQLDVLHWDRDSELIDVPFWPKVDSFKSREELKKYIEENLDTVYDEVVVKDGEGKYVLNCYTKFVGIGLLFWERYQKEYATDIQLFLPVIRKFLTEEGEEDIEENGKLVKQ